MVNDCLPYVLVAVAWSAVAVTLEKQAGERAVHKEVHLPSLSGVIFVAGFMLANQASAAYKRYKQGLDVALELEEHCIEVVRHGVMLFDTEELAWLRVEVRRTMLAVLLAVIVDAKTEASRGGAEYKAIGMECLRRAADANLLSKDECRLLFVQKMAPRIFTRVSSRTLQSKVVRLLYSRDYESWRNRWQNEKTLQPIVNFVKTLDSHWKIIISCQSGMVLLTEQNFPLHYMQMSRILWLIVIIFFPLDQAADLGYFTCAVTFVFVVSYFSMDLISTDLENPFGIHDHAIDLQELYRRVEHATASMLASCGQSLVGASVESDDPAARDEARHRAEATRYDAKLMVDPLGQGKTTAEIRRAAISKHFRRTKNGTAVVDNFQEGDGMHGGMDGGIPEGEERA